MGYCDVIVTFGITIDHKNFICLSTIVSFLLCCFVVPSQALMNGDLCHYQQPVWPDVLKLKEANFFWKVAQEVAEEVFTLKGMFAKITPKVNQISGLNL